MEYLLSRPTNKTAQSRVMDSLLLAYHNAHGGKPRGFEAHVRGGQAWSALEC